MKFALKFVLIHSGCSVWILLSFVCCDAIQSEESNIWTNAYNICTYHHNGTIIDVAALAQSSKSGLFWTGNYTVYSSWIQKEGCFIVKRELLNSTRHKCVNNVGECQLFCSNFPFFAKKDNLCICANQSKLYNQTDYSCCINNEMRKCNTSNSYAMAYSEVKNTIETIGNHENGDKCVSVSCKTANTFTYQADNCSKLYGAICSNGNVTYEVKTWKQAEDYCVQQTKSFAHKKYFPTDPQKFYLRSGCGKLENSGRNENKPTYWISIFREEVGNPSLISRMNHRIAQCQFVFLNDKGISYHWTKNCSEQKYPFCCKAGTGQNISKLGNTTSEIECSRTPESENSNTVKENKKRTTNGGMVAGIVVGCGAVIGVVSVAICLKFHQKRKHKNEDYENQENTKGKQVFRKSFCDEENKIYTELIFLRSQQQNNNLSNQVDNGTGVLEKKSDIKNHGGISKQTGENTLSEDKYHQTVPVDTSDTRRGENSSGSVDDDDIYVEDKENQYDVLNEHRNKITRNSRKEDIYDHTISGTEDNAYDTTKNTRHLDTYQESAYDITNTKPNSAYGNYGYTESSRGTYDF